MAEKRGRKNIYNSKIKSRFKDIAKWSKEGATERSIAKKLGISYSTFNKYKAEKKEFMELLINSKNDCVDDIENSTFLSAIGFTKTIKKAMKLKDVQYENGKRLSETERIEFYDEEVYYPPNVNAQKFLLMNWGKDRGYSHDPQSLEVKKEELELKKKVADKNEWF